MNTQVNYMIAQQRSDELQRATERARLRREVCAGRHKSRGGGPGGPRLGPVTRVGAQPAQGTSRGITALEVEPAVGSRR
jgi:hypothetical protein